MGLRLLADFKVWVWLWLVKLCLGWKKGFLPVSFVEVHIARRRIWIWSFLHIHPELTFFFSLPSRHLPLFLSHKYTLYAQIHTKKIYLLTQRLSVSLNTRRPTVHTYLCFCETFKPWQQFKKTSKRVLLAGGCSTSPPKVCKNTMCLSSPLSWLICALFLLSLSHQLLSIIFWLFCYIAVAGC